MAGDDAKPLTVPALGALAAACALLLAACGGREPPAPAAAAQSTVATPGDGTGDAPADAALATALPRHHWRLREATAADGRRIDALLVRADAPVTLAFADGRIAVSNTCNTMSGGYRLDGATLAVARLVSTMMACADPALMALDREVGGRLEAPLQATLATGATPTLTLATAAGERLVFEGVPTPQARHGGPGERLFLEVAAATRRCPDPLIADRQCLQVRELHYDERGLRVGEPGEFQHFYGHIDGYDHVPGVRNVLRVDRWTLEDPPADGSRFAYVLDMVVESANESAP